MPSLHVHSSSDRLRRLQRTDKWFLSGGDGILWAPLCPLWLKRPGFWDEATIHHYSFAPLFSVALVDSDGRELPLEHIEHLWQPDRLTVEWQTAGGTVLTEERRAEGGGRFISSWRCHAQAAWHADALRGAHLVAFTAQPAPDVSTVDRPVGSSAISWRRTTFDRHGIPMEIRATLGVDTSLNEWAIRTAACTSEAGHDHPCWRHTPFAEKWQRDLGIREGLTVTGAAGAGVLFMAIDIPLGAVRESRVAVSATLAADLPTKTPMRTQRAGTDTPSWETFLDSFPQLTCTNPFVTRYYDYRLFGLRLNRLSGDCGNILYPAIAEGPGSLHLPIAYSAPCHMWETRWARSPDLAQGSLLNFLAHQREDGSLHGRLHANHLEHTDFYHANWGDAALAVDALHEDDAFLATAYHGLARYAQWLDDDRDTEMSGMYDLRNHCETGQEYMSRYQSADAEADQRGWQSTMRLKGIDVTVYAYQLKRSLEAMAARLGFQEAAATWRAGADRIGRAVRDTMWDEDTGLFSDVEPRTMRRTRVKAAVCFYPLLTDLLDEPRVVRLLEHLQNREEFATPYPVPSSSRDDPMFSAYGEWKGKRRDCPWNGRVWPMTNSHILEGLLRQWLSGRRAVGRYAARLLTRFLSMMFHDRDAARPNCYEHYNPLTGDPSVHRGIDDHQRSWIVDLLIRGVAGVNPSAGGVAIDPLPLSLDEVRLVGATIRGRSVELLRTGSTIHVTVDGASHTTHLGKPLFIPYR